MTRLDLDIGEYFGRHLRHLAEIEVRGDHNDYQESHDVVVDGIDA